MERLRIVVVWADGLRSTVRRLAVDDRLPTPVGQHRPPHPAAGR
jgi:hypothetical protein